MEQLYGTLNGGGVISVAIRGDIVASSGREGGARVWRIRHFDVDDDIVDGRTDVVDDDYSLGLGCRLLSG